MKILIFIEICSESALLSGPCQSFHAYRPYLVIQGGAEIKNTQWHKIYHTFSNRVHNRPVGLCQAIIVGSRKKGGHAKTICQIDYVGLYTVMLSKSDIIDCETFGNNIFDFRIVIKYNLEIFYLYKPFHFLQTAPLSAVK